MWIGCSGVQRKGRKPVLLLLNVEKKFLFSDTKKVMSHKEKKALKKQKKMDEEMEKITKKGGQVSLPFKLEFRLYLMLLKFFLKGAQRIGQKLHRFPSPEDRWSSSSDGDCSRHQN